MNQQIELINRTPEKMSGKDWEENLLYRSRRMEDQGVMTMNRYGTMATIINGVWTPVPSLPDFEGMITSRFSGPDRHVHFILEAKVCSQSKYQFGSSLKDKQLRHMLKRARFGSLCALAIHWNQRSTTKRVIPAASFLFPVHDTAFWDAVTAGDEPGISRQQCETDGIRIEWGTVNARSRKISPALEQALIELRTREYSR